MKNITKTGRTLEPKYRFKTLEEFEATCKNSKGAFTCGRDVFSTDMHHLLGLQIPDVFSEQIIDNKHIYLDLGDIVPGENNYWGFTPEMLKLNEQEEGQTFDDLVEEVEAKEAEAKRFLELRGYFVFPKGEFRNGSFVKEADL